MADSNSGFKSGVITDYFEIGEYLWSTGSSDAYRANIIGVNDSVILWKTRSPLQDEDDVKDFTYRVKLLKKLEPIVLSIESFGVDSESYGFVVLQRLDGVEISSTSHDSIELERRFTTCLSIVNRFHQKGYFCGSLTDASFWLNRNGDLRFMGVAGGAVDVNIAPLNVVPFIPPELVINKASIPNPLHDIFSLGVLGYYLFTNNYPFGTLDQYKARTLTSEVIDPAKDNNQLTPVWLKSLVEKACQANPGDRYQSIDEMLADLSELRAKAHADKAALTKRSANNALLLKPTDGVQTHSINKNDKSFFKKKTLRKLKEIPFTVKAIGLFFLLTFISFFVVKRIMGNRIEVAYELRKELNTHREAAANEEIKKAIDVLSEPDASSKQKQNELNKLIESNDPLTHSILTEIAIHAPDRIEQQKAEVAIVERLRILNFKRTASQLAIWLNSLGDKVDMAAYQQLFKAVDPSAPADARTASLKISYQAFPKTTFLIAASLAFDLKNGLEDMRQIIIALAQDVYELEDAERRSTLAVMLASPDLALMYNDEILGKQAEIPAEDLIWAQEYIVGHNQMLAQTVAEIVLQRGKISKVRAEILKILVSRGSSASGVANSLIRASAGKVSKEDILNLASWYDKNSEKALFLICADKEVSQDVKSAALDALAGKGLTVEPGISLIDWVRRNYWEDRARFAYAIGVFSSAEFVDEKELTEAFLTLDEAIKNSDLVQVLIKTENSQIITSLVAKYNEILGLGILIKLLEHDDKNVRISTVKALEKYNDLGALKLIIDHYKKEEDPEVKQVYKDTFWVIRKHEEKV